MLALLMRPVPDLIAAMAVLVTIPPIKPPDILNIRRANASFDKSKTFASDKAGSGLSSSLR